ncbi:MAG TPA: branched-chain amino acid ABC transporter permease [Pseudolabrys sp.]|nr:branched-chain amino acid ABC transporter permease [Pseudolabrys sp.]
MLDLLPIFAQQLINGLVLGSIYVLATLGLTLIFGVLGQINFAHADFVTLGAFAAFFVARATGGNYLIAIFAALLVGALLGSIINGTVFSPLRNADETRPLVATIGVSVLLENTALAFLGPVPYAFDSPYSSQVIRAAGLFFTVQNLLVVIIAVLAVGSLYAFMKLTFIGKALRALAQDREAAGLMGINQKQLIALTFIIGSAFAGLAGAMLGPILVLTPFAGASVIVKAFAIVIIGGFGNIEGTIVAGLLIGLIESFTAQFLSPGMSDIVVFGLLLLTLAFRPTGLIAERREENV